MNVYVKTIKQGHRRTPKKLGKAARLFTTILLAFPHGIPRWLFVGSTYKLQDVLLGCGFVPGTYSASPFSFSSM